MNDFWKTILGSIARTSLGAASGYAISKGTITADDATQIVGVAGAAVTGIWSIIQKVRAK